jgi:hypothetical protein
MSGVVRNVAELTDVPLRLFLEPRQKKNVPSPCRYSLGPFISDSYPFPLRRYT